MNPDSVGSHNKKLIVVVPAYNEHERITETVIALMQLKNDAANKGVDMLIYVVNDGSTDDTAQLARAAGVDRIVNHKLNQGLGAAIRSGLAAAKADDADIVVKFDADLQHDPCDVLSIIEPILADEADIVYGNRFEKIEYRMPFLRRIGNLVFTRLMRWLTNWDLKDSQPGIFAVERAYLEQFYLPGDYNYTQQILLDAYHKSMRFAHVSVTFRKRTSGKSFISLKYPFKVLPQIVMVLVGVRPLRVFGPIGLMFLIGGILIFCWDFTMWLLNENLKPAQHVNAIMGMSFFGLQTLFFGLLADLIVRTKGR